MKGSTNIKLKKTIKEDIADIRSILDVIMEFINRHEKQIDNLQMKLEPLKTQIPKETKWIGCLCKFKDHRDKDWQRYDILEYVDYASTDGIFGDRLSNHWQECEIVKLTDPEIYKISQKDLQEITDSVDAEEYIRRFLSKQKTNVDFSYLKKDK